MYCWQTTTVFRYRYQSLEASWPFQDNQADISSRLFQKNPAPYILEEFNDCINLTNQYSDEALLTQENYELANEKKTNHLILWTYSAGLDFIVGKSAWMVR